MIYCGGAVLNETQDMAFVEPHQSCHRVKTPRAQQSAHSPTSAFCNCVDSFLHQQFRVEDDAKQFESLAVRTLPVKNMERLLARIEQHLIRTTPTVKRSLAST